MQVEIFIVKKKKIKKIAKMQEGMKLEMKNSKEIVICSIIIVAIVILNVITQSYTKECVDTVNDKLSKLRDSLIQEKAEEGSVKNKTDEIMKDWQHRYQKLAYFIEHDELEKVETELTSLKANIEIGEYEQSVSDLDKTVFILNHIKNKFTLEIRNIF